MWEEEIKSWDGWDLSPSSSDSLSPSVSFELSQNTSVRFILVSVCSVSPEKKVEGGQLPAHNVSPWRPAKWHLGPFPGGDEEGAFRREQRSCRRKDAADTCPLHSWWIRLLTLEIFTLFQSPALNNVPYTQCTPTVYMWNVLVCLLHSCRKRTVSGAGSRGLQV